MMEPVSRAEQVVAIELGRGKALTFDHILEEVRKQRAGDSTDAKFAVFKLVREGKARFDLEWNVAPASAGVECRR